MPEKTTGNTTGAKTADTNPKAATPPLDTALAQLEVVRGDFRNAIAGLNKLGDLLRQVQRESKASDKERVARERVLETARSALGVVA